MVCMGNASSLESEVVFLRDELRKSTSEIHALQRRMAGLEKDVSNLSVVLKTAHETSQQNSDTLFNISLLEEGRSVYRKPTRHTASTYK